MKTSIFIQRYGNNIKKKKALRAFILSGICTQWQKRVIYGLLK